MKKLTTLPKNLFQNGFEQKGDYIDINVLGNIREFIRNNFEKRKTFNTSVSSYGLKDLVERHLLEIKLKNCYVSNGELIASMILEGYNYKRVKLYPKNAYFNVTKNPLRKLKFKRQNYEK